jgi:hypothetical protein
MTVNEMIKKLQEYASNGKGDFPVKCIWTEADEDGEEYNIEEDALLYDPCTKNEIWVTY